MSSATPIAVCCSDLHLSLLKPACRADKDWMDVQAEYLMQLRDIAGDIPVLIAGDIFDRWNPPPELINFALEHLPTGAICVPGQHDLPNHRIEDMQRSAYGVLVQAEKIIDISDFSGTGNHYAGFTSVGFGWNAEIKTISTAPSGIKIALIHRYVWTEEKGFPDAPKESYVSAYKKQLKGYDIAIFGDNHKGFKSTCGDCIVYNCGGFIRRKSDEIDYEPSVGIIYSDGTIKRRKLDTSIDRFQKVSQDRPEVDVDMKQFIDMLESMGEQGLNFKDAVETYLKKNEVHPKVKQLLLQSLESNDN